MNSFSTLGLGPGLLGNLARVGFDVPTPIQSKAIPEALAGRDLIGIAQTGTGKTAAFVLPILEKLLAEGSGRPATAIPPLGRPYADRGRSGRNPRALVLAPTRELAAQIHETVVQLAGSLPIRSAVIFGGVGEQPQIVALRRGVDILIATPGRLIDLMGQRHVSLGEVRYAVLDEADRMLDMGFLPQIRKVVATLPRERQTLLFSATLSRDIERVTAEVLRTPVTVEIGGRANPAASVTQVLHPVEKARKIDLLLEILKDPAMDSVLVFSRTKHGADKIARKLSAWGIATATIHSNRSQSQRTKALAQFKDGRVRVLVATDIAARGIDVEEISHVINFDFPVNPEDYVHRIGRTGRAAATGDAVSFITAEDEPAVRDLERLIGKRVERKAVPGFSQLSAPSASRPPMPRPQGTLATPSRHRHPRPGQQGRRASAAGSRRRG